MPPPKVQARSRCARVIIIFLGGGGGGWLSVFQCMHSPPPPKKSLLFPQMSPPPLLGLATGLNIERLERRTCIWFHSQGEVCGNTKIISTASFSWESNPAFKDQLAVMVSITCRPTFRCQRRSSALVYGRQSPRYLSLNLINQCVGSSYSYLTPERLASQVRDQLSI